MRFKINSQHLTRYRDISRLLVKYGRSDVIQHLGVDDDLLTADISHDGKGRPEELADDLERMGPTYVKLGQVLSSRPDLVPYAYIKALSRLQDAVKPFPFEQVEQIIQSELGARISKAFSVFEPEPLAAASLGQVHRAALRDGRPVVVKVQRPDIRPQIAEDLEVLEEIAAFLQNHTRLGRRYQFMKVFEQFKRTLIHELDYQREASNLATIAENLAEFRRIRIPRPIDDYTTRSVLTMEYVAGRKITKIGPLARMEIPGHELADELFRAYLKQVLVDGLFHADPHPGNVFLTDDGHLALLDLGMVGRVSPVMQEKLIKLLITISEGRGDESAEIVFDLSETRDGFDEADFRARVNLLVAEQQNITLKEINVGKVLIEVTRTAGETGLFVPTELTLLGKTLLQLDEIGRQLDPQFNPNAAIRQHVVEIANRRLRKTFTSGKVLSSVLELKDFLGALPGRVGRIMDSIAKAELELKVKATDIHLLLEGFQKIANRITTGLILAALIIGASLLMQVQTAFRIFGYPGLAILFFLLAAGMGFWLVVTILLQDYKRKKSRTKSSRG